MKKAIILLLTTLPLLIFHACEKDKPEIKFSDMNGTWINENDGNDTIVFSSKFPEPTFEVKRGKEWSGDFYLPKSGSGLYRYKIEKDSIYVQWIYSSYNGYIQHNISINEAKNKFSVNGNFTLYPSEETQFTYKKID